MDENEPVQENHRNFGLPLCLLSLVFFGFYLFAITGLLVLGMLSWVGAALLLLPCGLLLVSLTGAILIVREMKAQALRWMAGIPLCVLLGLIIVSMVLFMSPGSGPVQFYLGVIAVAGFMCLPAGVAYLLRGLKGTESAAAQSFAKATGIFGLAISGLMLFLVIITSWMRGVEPVYLVILLFSLFHILILMPLLGDKLFRLGLSFSKIPAAEAGTGGAAEPVPRKKIAEIIRDIPRSLSPRTKWAILVLVALVLVVAGCSVYWDITDTTPGRKWAEVTDSAPFGALSGFTTAEYRGNLWIIGGGEYVGNDGEAWYTRDGVTWKCVSSASTVPQRMGASSAVFMDALWVIGGKTAETHESHNDIWYSSDGLTWSDIQPSAEFAPRSGHSTVVFHDRLWIIGGDLGSDAYINLTNDVWNSDNAITWSQVIPAAGFSRRYDHSSFVYQDKLWVIGGQGDNGYLHDTWNSVDGTHWTQATTSAPFGDTSIRAVVFDGRMWVFQTTFGKKGHYPWGTEKSPGIWYSYDGITWTSVMSSPGFFEEEYNGRQPQPVVFDNRLFVLQQYDRGTGIWYTMPSA